ncbi:hypothetical protein ACFE04_026121 [Oxalis oulophora]
MSRRVVRRYLQGQGKILYQWGGRPWSFGKPLNLKDLNLRYGNINWVTEMKNIMNDEREKRELQLLENHDLGFDIDVVDWDNNEYAKVPGKPKILCINNY